MVFLILSVMFIFMNIKQPDHCSCYGSRTSVWELIPLLIACLFLILPVHPLRAEISASNTRQITQYLKNGSALVVDQNSKVLFAYNADKAMVPASILKLATADAVLTTFGEDYKIATEFYLSRDNYLVIKGYGDPSLVSESLSDIARHLKPILKNRTLKGIWLDNSFFKAQQKVNGQSSSNNPYDAAIGALVVNFNTIFVHKSRQGKLSSAESQTPLTSTARLLAKNISTGKHRINLGGRERLTLKYFAELLQIKLQQQDIHFEQPLTIVHKILPPESSKIYTHYSRPLNEIVKQLLQYSNNFTANQLLLILGARSYGIPADLDKGQKALSHYLSNIIGLKKFTLVEGSGLSRLNQFTAEQMISILQHFEPYYYLLRGYDEKFLAKTGTLKGVATFAGFMLAPDGQMFPFVIMLDKPEYSRYRYKIAELLYDLLFIKSSNH